MYNIFSNSQYVLVHMLLTVCVFSLAAYACYFV